jgi:hypothetical protein
MTTTGMRVYAPGETGGRLTVGELVKLLADVPQEAGVFFTYEHEIADEPIVGLTAEREPVETVQVVYWHNPDGPDSVGYVRLVSYKRGDTWAERFPYGRTIAYAGGEPEEFREQVKAEFGVDPGANADWGKVIDECHGGRTPLIWLPLPARAPRRHLR